MANPLIKTKIKLEETYRCSNCDDEIETCDNCCDELEEDEVYCTGELHHFCSKKCAKEYDNIN